MSNKGPAGSLARETETHEESGPVEQWVSRAGAAEAG